MFISTTHLFCSWELVQWYMLPISFICQPASLLSTTCLSSVSRIFSILLCFSISSVQCSCSVKSNSLWPHGLQQARAPCPSPNLRVYSNSCPLSQWCHPTISSSVVPFSFCLQSLKHQDLFQWVSSLHHVAKILEFQLSFLLTWLGYSTQLLNPTLI